MGSVSIRPVQHVAPMDLSGISDVPHPAVDSTAGCGRVGTAPVSLRRRQRGRFEIVRQDPVSFRPAKGFI